MFLRVRRWWWVFCHWIWAYSSQLSVLSSHFSLLCLFAFVCMWLQGQGRRVRSIKESFVLCNKEREHVSQSLNVSLSHSTCDWLKLQSRLHQQQQQQQNTNKGQGSIVRHLVCFSLSFYFPVSLPGLFSLLWHLSSHFHCLPSFTARCTRSLCQVPGDNDLCARWSPYFLPVCPSMHPGHLWHLNGHFSV